jgi:outer membrane lipoprotein-sorting protein
MKRLRTTSTRRLLTILACAGVLATTAAIAQAALGGSNPVPSPKALAQAIKDAIGAPAPDGVTARISFTNNLLPSGSLPGTSSALTSGADGRLWLTKDGRFRLELQSASGDAQIAGDAKHVTIFDGSSNTLYKATLPDAPADARKREHAHENPTVAKIQQGLDRLAKLWTVSDATPTSTAGQPTYTVRVAPKDDGGLLGAAELAWDAATGVPLRAAVYAQGQADPVLELEATDISYGAVSDSDLATTPPAGAKVVDLSPKASTARADARAHGGARGHAGVDGADAVGRELDFPLAAPDKLAGLPRQGVHLVDFGERKGALVTYGKGLGAIVVLQHETGAKDGADAKPRSEGHGRREASLPQINIDGTTGTELATALGTVVTFERDGVSYVVAGSVPPLAAENAARGLR